MQNAATKRCQSQAAICPKPVTEIKADQNIGIDVSEHIVDLGDAPDRQQE
jgi:hypothetical protein